MEGWKLAGRARILIVPTLQIRANGALWRALARRAGGGPAAHFRLYAIALPVGSRPLAPAGLANACIALQRGRARPHVCMHAKYHAKQHAHTRIFCTRACLRMLAASCGNHRQAALDGQRNLVLRSHDGAGRQAQRKALQHKHGQRHDFDVGHALAQAQARPGVKG